MVRQLAGQQQLDASEDFFEREGPLLGVSDQLSRQNRDLVESVVDHRIHDVHGFFADAFRRVHLSEHLVDVDAESLVSLLLRSPLACWLDLFDGLVSFSGLADCFFGWHGLLEKTSLC